MATILHADGRTESIQPQNGTDFTLAELRAIVGEGAPIGQDHIEIVETRDGSERIMVINEEGKLLDLPRNEAATNIALIATPADLAIMRMILGDNLIYVGPDLQEESEDYIAGTVLVCENHEVR